MVDSTEQLESLERWSHRLFILAGVFLLVAASNRGIAFFLENVAFNDWIGLAGLFGRLAALLGTGGLALQIEKRTVRLGKLNRTIASLAVVFTTGLLTLAILENVGVTTPIIAVFGIGTLVLSFVTFSLFGVSIIRTGAHSTLIGSLLLIVALLLLVVFIGQTVVPEGLIGTVIEGLLFVLYLTIGYRLQVEKVPSRRTESVADATP
ncbi:hypothetical protein [Halostella sp. PRR32]|uniref:hypothetical protein n=1 Tax=Halostella sp. PRR32 TaxID=3098147 RepID=UPI002B1D8C07|nr:hypothetical protein [Halostella sp. PRR32]